MKYLVHLEGVSTWVVHHGELPALFHDFDHNGTDWSKIHVYELGPELEHYHAVILGKCVIPTDT